MVELTLEQQRALALAEARRRQAEAVGPAVPPAPPAAPAAPARDDVGVAGHLSSGLNEGIANMAGMPVDAMTWGLNKLGMGIEKPFGGSESLKGMLAPVISDAAPDSAVERITRRVGQDVGAGAVAGPVSGVASLGGLALNTAADVGSGVAGAITSEVTDNPVANVVASLLGGGAVVAGAKAARPGPQAPSNDALRARENELWQQVRDSNVRLTPNASQELKGNVSARAFDMRMKPSLHGPEATSAVDEVWSLPDRPSLWDVEEARRFIGDNTPAGYDKASTSRVMTGLKGEIDAYLDNIPHPDAGIAKEARDVSRRRIASEKLDRTLDRAERQAARANNGANVVNSQRGRIDAILNSPKERASFKPSELEQMEAIVRGTTGTNAARTIGSISPTRGGMYAAANALGFGAGVGTGDPLMMALTAAPGAISMVARQIGEKLTDQQIQRLSATIRNGSVPIPGKALSEAEQAVLSALLGVQAANQAEQ